VLAEEQCPPPPDEPSAAEDDDAPPVLSLRPGHVASDDEMIAGGKRSTPWPTLNPAALHGLAGECVAQMAPHTESDPVALLLSTLVGFGSLVGAGPHALADSARHPARLNVVLVGDTSRARKGTSWQNARRPLGAADPEWHAERVMSGLSSGEGLIATVRDPDAESDADLPPVTTDRRLLVVEPEFARVLQVAGRDGNTLSAQLRECYDTGDLRVLTRRDPLRATGAHVSVLGHVTTDELRKRLSGTEVANGFANRFLFACVRRSKMLPSGGQLEPHVVEGLGLRLRAAAYAARKRSVLRRTDAAEALWRELYGSFRDHPGLLGAVTARPEAHTLRLSVTYALLDQSSVIDVVHLRAADAVWRFCEDSALRIFGDATGDPVVDRLLDRLRLVESMTRNEVRDLFGRHESAERLDGVIRDLEASGQVLVRQEPTAGRPRTVLALRRAVSAVSDQSHAARESGPVTAHGARKVDGGSPL